MKYVFQIFMFMLVTWTSCVSGNREDEWNDDPDTTAAYFNGDKVLVVYFSWSGNTRAIAEQIQTITGGDIFEIVPQTAYPTAYTPCTEVAREEKDNDARPTIKNSVQDWEQYDVVFIGCPVWWWTTPMIIHSFAESYDFSGKTVIPFCTYASTYRDETLQAIVDMTPQARHLQGRGTTNSSSSMSGTKTWIESISKAYKTGLNEAENTTPPEVTTTDKEVTKTDSIFTSASTVGDVIADSAFGDFGRLLFPVDRNVPSSMTLAQVSTSTVYVWYSNIKVEKTVEVLNNLHNEARAGKQIFYNIYSDAEIAADRTKVNTGLFFFRGEKGAPFAIVNAGGGFMYVGAMHDSFPHSLELSKNNLNAFALIYRPDNPYEDLARALVFIHDNAAALGVRADGYALWGGSAGARMAAVVGNDAYLQQLTARSDLPQASAVIMQYTGYSYVSAYDAPTYVCVGTNDGIASWQTMKQRLQQLSELGIPTEFHAYDGLSHGFGLGTGTVAEGWINDAIQFWQNNSNKHYESV